MSHVHYPAVVAAAVAGFVASFVWYIIFARARAELSGNVSGTTSDIRRPQPAKLLVEVVRNFVVAYVLVRLVISLGIAGWTDAAQLAAWLWVGFPCMILLGSVQWETPGSSRPFMPATGS